MRMQFAGNPVVSNFTRAPAFAAGDSEMSVQGVMNKTLLAALVMLATAAYAGMMVVENPGQFRLLAGAGALGGTVLFLWGWFKPAHCRYVTLPYAACEGVALGALTMMAEQIFPGIGGQAIAATLVTFGVTLFLYKAGVIKPTQRMRSVATAAGFALILFHVGACVGSVAGAPGLAQTIYGSGLLGIGFSVFAVGLAALFLIIAFGDIEKAVAQRQPSVMEWYATLGLLIILVWLYVEMLRLLMKLRSNR